MHTFVCCICHGHPVTALLALLSRDEDFFFPKSIESRTKIVLEGKDSDEIGVEESQTWTCHAKKKGELATHRDCFLWLPIELRGDCVSAVKCAILSR